MTTCEHCRDRLLDHVYGLLEGSDLEETRAHLGICSECQTALEQVRTEQALFACAARAITEIPEFTLPANEPAATPAAPAPTTLPMSAPASKRPVWRRAWVGWTAAAAVLLAVSASFSAYRHNLNHYESVLAEKRQEHKAIVERFAALPASYEALQQQALQDLRANAGPYLHVVGPKTLQPGAKAHLHITSYHVEGTPRQVKSKSDFARIDLRVKFVQVQANKVKALNLKCDDDGQAIVEIDASDAEPNSTLQVMVEASSAHGQTRVQEAMQIVAPTYVTRIDTNKIAYQFKDVLFFRVLMLDRYTLQPPSHPVAMRVELVSPQGQAVRSLDMQTSAGGILAREFAIDDKFLEGQYTLNVRPLDPAKTHVQPASQRLEIVRVVRVPEFRFDQDTYRAGENLTGWYRGSQPLPNEAEIDGKPVPITSPSAPPGAGGGGPKSKDGKEFKGVPADALEHKQAFAIPLPATLPTNAARLPITMQFPGGKKKMEIPLAPTDFTIDFFPEGGDLIAGVPNRVFYRVRSKSGEPVIGDGQVMLENTRNDIVDSTYQLGMGYLDFVPHPKETYTARITTPAKIETITAPFAKLGMRSEGVVIQVADLGNDHAPKAVGNQGDPIRLTIRQQGPTRKLLLLAQCRDQIVDQRWIDLERDPVDVTLNPTQEAVGMIRITAYEVQETPVTDKLTLAAIGFAQAPMSKTLANTLQPVAERLVYRHSSQRLDLGFTLNKQQLQPGPVSATATARDEKGQPAGAWLLASVIDERFQARPRSLSAHFFLLNEIRTGPDLDNAHLILHDSPESAQILERFLGTHGWRRFVRTQEPGIRLTAPPAIFSRESMPFDVMQMQYDGKLAAALSPVQRAGITEGVELEDLRSRLEQAVDIAATDLRAFEERVQFWSRFSLALAFGALLLTSLFLMGAGLYRIIRAHKAATPAFGGAFACLSLCIGIAFVGSLLGPIDVPQPPGVFAQGRPALEINKEMEDRFAKLQPARPRAANLPAGAFKLQAEKQREAQIAPPGMDGRGLISDQIARRTLGEGTHPVLAKDKQEIPKLRSENKAMRDRYDAAASIGKSAAKTDQKLEKAGVEYFHQHVQNVPTDTLLWHPNLWLADGHAEVRFDIGSGNATYRVLLLGHSPTGRFGFYETRLDVLGR